MEPGTKEWLNDPSRTLNYDDLEGGESANTDKVLLKDNEPGSYGVGTELLNEFNDMVKSVTVTKL